MSEFKREIGPPPILPFGGGQCEFRVCMGLEPELGRVSFASAVAPDVWSGAHVFARVELDSVRDIEY